MKKVPFLSVAADEAFRLTEHRPAILLIGSYDGSGNYGDICLFEAALSLLSTLGPEPLLLPVIERQYIGSHLDLRARVAADFGAPCFLYYDEQDSILDAGMPTELAAIAGPPGFSSSAIYFYGGGYLNEMWGRRKLAMARAVDEWVTSGTSDRSQPLVVFTGQQVDGGFLDDPEAERWLRRASLFGVRDLQSAENVTGRLPELAARSVLAVAEDDAVGVLGEIPQSSDAIHASPSTRTGDFHVDLHLSGESYATTDGNRLGGFVADLLTAIQHETARHVSVRLVIAYDDGRISERQFAQAFAAKFSTSPYDARPISFTVEDATDRRIHDPRWERQRPDLTISCSYHVAMTSLLHDVPVVYLFQTDYYRQKAASLQAGFGLSPELTVDTADPGADAGLVAGIAVGLLSDPQHYEETICRLRLARARALGLRHLVSSRLIALLSAHASSAHTGVNTDINGKHVNRSLFTNEKPRNQRWIALKRGLALLRTRLQTIRSYGDTEARFQDLQRSVDELRANLDSLSSTLTSVGATTDGHEAWLTDLQTWMTSCVQMLTALADVPPVPSAHVQAGAPPARRRDDVEEIKRQLQIWTTMAWLDQADVPCDRLISVVMPTRNRGGWIGRAIASIEAQTYGHWELIVVDDDSSDDTAALVAAAAARDARIRYLHIEHAGAPAARNVALAHSTGDIVCYLDDDNVMHRNWLKSVAWAIKCWPETEILYGARIIEDDLTHEATGSANFPNMTFSPWNRRRLESSNYIDQNVIAHRAGLPEAHFDEALPMCQDWDLMLRLTARRRPLELPVLACFYSTTAPHRGSDQPDQLPTIHRVRAGAHLGRPLRLLALSRRPEYLRVEMVDSDMAALAEAGAHVATADGRLEPPGGDEAMETSWLVAAVAEHDPDIVLVYGINLVAELVAPLEAAGRPFAVRLTKGDAGAGVAGFPRHSLLLGLWKVPEHDAGDPAAAGFLDELADCLRTWKLGISEN
jgi:hypothetical protein